MSDSSKKGCPDFYSFFDLPNTPFKLNPSTNLSHFNHLSELPSKRKLYISEKKYEILLVEPFTLSWVALQLVEGAISAIGGKIFNSIFSQDLDIVELIEKALKQVEIIVREAISEDAIRRCVARIEALKTVMKQYLNSSSTSLDRLYSASMEAVGLASECKSLGFKAILPYATAIGLQILILQERRQRFNEEGEKANIIDLCEEASNYVFNVGFPAFRAWMDSRFSQVIEPKLHHEFPEIFSRPFYVFNGKFYSALNRDLAIKAREEHLIRETIETQNELYGSTWDIAMNWIEIAKKYKSQ